MYFYMRSAINDFVKIVKENRKKFPTGVVHAFEGNRLELKRLLDLDLYIGLSGDSFKTEENIKMIK